tara:strand:- start:29 stop:370 length:342 start_codon:yes stop_codon:yes gene_type:complete
MNKVIFDNKCSLCIDIKNKLEKLDIKNKFLWVSSNKYMQSQNIHPKINQNMLNNTIVVINTNNNIMTEFVACRYILSKIPLFYPVLMFLYIPFISSWIGNRIYRIIAKLRECI